MNKGKIGIRTQTIYFNVHGQSEIKIEPIKKASNARLKAIKVSVQKIA
jgi:hypothetical protein